MTDEELVQAARAGNRAALEELVKRIQAPLYNLAVRMLWLPADAEDATQEILIKIITHFGEFRGDSRFRTWAWRIAANHLLTTRKRRAEQHALSFDEFADDLDHNFSDEALVVPDNVDERLLVEEAKIGCMQAMLLCLSREERAAYVVGEIFGMTDKEGAELFDITPAAYRKRLSRARKAIRDFMKRKCGLANPANRCRCRRRVKPAIEKQRLDPAHLRFARDGDDPAVLRGITEMDELGRAAALFRTHPTYQPPDTFQRNLRQLLDSGHLSFLN
ncbi:MAG: RNA polymerase sigma factor [Anaerolineae bacterium]|nr:RNA polymerase sigma factor [Anaerolineae bacterium]